MKKNWLVKSQLEVFGKYLILANAETGANVLLDLPRDVLINAYFAWDDPKKEKIYTFTISPFADENMIRGFNFKPGDEVTVKRKE